MHVRVTVCLQSALRLTNQNLTRVPIHGLFVMVEQFTCLNLWEQIVIVQRNIVSKTILDRRQIQLMTRINSHEKTQQTALSIISSHFDALQEVLADRKSITFCRSNCVIAQSVVLLAAHNEEKVDICLLPIDLSRIEGGWGTLGLDGRCRNWCRITVGCGLQRHRSRLRVQDRR